MSYTRWQTTWRNNPSGATPAPAAFFQYIEDNNVSLDSRITTLEAGGGSGGAVTSVAGRTGAVTLTKTDVGLINVDNTSDVSKPVSTLQTTAINAGDALAIPKSIATAKGDILGASGSSVIQRLPVGTNGQVLTANSVATLGVDWETPIGGGSSSSVFTVRVATTSPNGTVTTGPQVVDGISCIVNDRVLYKDSSTPTFNGIYMVQSGSWIRSTDMTSGVSVPAGVLLSVTEGTINGGREYQLGSITPGATSMVIGTNPLTFTQISPNKPPYVTVARNTSQNAYPIPTDGNFVVTIDADNPTIIVQNLYDNNPRIVNLVIVQDATGHPYQFSPSHIAWENGMIGPGNVPYDTSPLSQTLVRLTWMGILYGFYGEILNSILPLYYVPVPTATQTYSGTGTAFGGLSTQALNLNMYFPRNVATTLRQLYINAAMRCSSAAIRQKLLNNNVSIEISAYYSAEGPAGMPDRVLDVGAGTPQYLNRPIGSSPPPAAVLTAILTLTQVDYDAQLCHEFCHAMDANYYMGNNTPHSTQGAIPIRNHAALIAVYNDCVTNGGPSNNNEWFAELERQRRIGDNGNPTSVPPTGSMAVQLGTGTTTNTPAQRWNTFLTYMNGLGLV